jgi:hypothetical protein
MKKMVAYCGIICTDCPVFVVTQKNDDSQRQHLAETFTKQYATGYKPMDINCDGCLSDGSRVFSYCNKCEIRKCGKEKHVVNCAYCRDYPCEKLSKIFTEHSKAKETLDQIKHQLQSSYTL